MASSTTKRTETNVSKVVAIIGSNVAAIQTALTIAQMGIEVKVITEKAALGYDAMPDGGYTDQRLLWPLALRTATHPLVKLYYNAEVESISGKKGNFTVRVGQHPRYVKEELCTSCGRCEAECTANVVSLVGSRKISHHAIHAPLLPAIRTVSSAYMIDKNGAPPCRVACPLGINVQGFVSLLASGKTDRALELINEAAPLAGILGRVCTHPCEDNCNRAKVDSPISIRALHRYAADNAGSDTLYQHKYPIGSRKERIAIVGSGPGGLTAAWQLARLGYSPTVFESHSVIGGTLATGIPRFRLPREVREREIEAIKNMGVDIRTGITVGRDVPFAYLKERGYKAFFLAIGTQRNSKLNIPGEELEGVVDCMSLLLTLNLKVDTLVGSNIVVIGGGNAAIDSARSTIRSGAKRTTIIYRRTRAKMPAAPEEVEAAIQEGVKIEYRTIPVEILGAEGRVTGIRCQQVESTDDIPGNEWHRVKSVPDSDFVISADHVVVAIGQSPDALQLGMEELTVDNKTGLIKINPLTLQTSTLGVFAGGDCITGPNNVVEAMAAGLRAAESIHRYIQGQDLSKGRTLEPPQTAKFDIEAAMATPYKRAVMPTIPLKERTTGFEETTKGLSAKAAKREAQRCLNCAMCSQCMECTRTCQQDAVFHSDNTRHFDLKTDVIIRFPPHNSDGNGQKDNHMTNTTTNGINMFHVDTKEDSINKTIAGAIALAMQTVIDIGGEERKESATPIAIEPSNKTSYPGGLKKHDTGTRRLGVFLCNCGGSISSTIDFETIARSLSKSPLVGGIYQIAQACTDAGARQIAKQMAEWQLDRMILAACRCCNLEQLCYSCTDRRSMCLRYIDQHLMSSHGTAVEFVNIREHCAWAHKDDPVGAARKALKMILSSLTHVRSVHIADFEKLPILPSVMVISYSLASISAISALASQGYKIYLISKQGIQAQQNGNDKALSLLRELQTKKTMIKTWPDRVSISGSPGNYQALLKYDSQCDSLSIGAVLLDIEEPDDGPFVKLDLVVDELPGQSLLHRRQCSCSGNINGGVIREMTINEIPGIFLWPDIAAKPEEEQLMAGLTTAARISKFLGQKKLSPRITAVSINNKLCRGCGDCADVCPYIEIRKRADGTMYAYIDQMLCLGCGACVSICPTGAIEQPTQSDKELIATLHTMLQPTGTQNEV